MNKILITGTLTLIIGLSFHATGARTSQKSERFYEFGSNVIKLKDEKQFKREVLESNFLWAIEFYREGCGYCQLLTPVWEKVSENLKNLVRVAAVDTERNNALASNHGDPSNPIQVEISCLQISPISNQYLHLSIIACFVK
jgi:thiol-disulfide isomerase/thioredoxin